MYEPAVRAHASALALVSSRVGDTWDDLSLRLHVPPLYLRLYNPFVTDARLRQSSFRIAYPTDALTDLFSIADDGSLRYRSRIGDNYINLAFALGVDLDRLRDVNGLWRLQVLPAHMLLTIPSGSAPTLEAGADRTTPDVEPAADIEAKPRAAQPPVRLAVARPSPRTHVVRRGETLTGLARRYDTTIRAIQRANNFGRRTTIRIGERLRIPQ
jgi:LysM repeat protein